MSKILFIDDDMLTLKLMNKEAEILGFQSYTCPDPLNAMQQVFSTNPDLILIDINMQDISGFEVVNQIRSHVYSATIPVLILSAGDPAVEGKKALEAGANGFLSKPLSIAGLESAVKMYAKQEQMICNFSF